MKKFFFLFVFAFLAMLRNEFNQKKIPFQEYEIRVRPAVLRMTLEEKIGQMTLVKYAFLQPTTQTLDYPLINRYHLGAVLAAGSEIPNGRGGVNDGLNELSVELNDPENFLTSTKENWIAINRQIDAHPVITNQGDVIPLLIGVDAVHGHASILGNVVFPHNIGLSVTHDELLLSEVGYWTAHDVLKTGFNWVYAPAVAISHNPNWGRTYETFGSVPLLTQKYTFQLVDGLQQQIDGKITGVLSTVKHYLGDGATLDGVDEGNVIANHLDHFMEVNKAGYEGAIQSSAGSIMISYNAINNLPMTFNTQLIQDLRKAKKYFDTPFAGLIVSDYGAIDKAGSQGLPTTTTFTPFPQALANAINSGIDLVMLSSTATIEKDLPSYLALFKQQVESGAISEERINDAVTHILAVKYAMGLIDINSQGQLIKSERPFLSNKKKYEEEINTAIRAAEESLVLLRNKNQLLPISSDTIEYVVLLGTSSIHKKQNDGKYIPASYANYDNIGIQTGGWTISWQGIEGNAFWQGSNKRESGATTLLEGIKKLVPKATIITSLDTLLLYPNINHENTIIIGALAEPPYAEFMGDIASPLCVNATDHQKGCLYHYHLNPYLPLKQKQSLAIDYEKSDLDFILAVTTVDPKIPLITVLFSGRPMIIQDPLDKSDAFIAAWLPGTTGGQAIANALFGKYLFCPQKGSIGTPNTLTVNWMRNMDQLKNYPIYDKGSGFVSYEDPLFKIGYGLSTQSKRG